MEISRSRVTEERDQSHRGRQERAPDGRRDKRRERRSRTNEELFPLVNGQQTAENDHRENIEKNAEYQELFRDLDAKYSRNPWLGQTQHAYRMDERGLAPAVTMYSEVRNTAAKLMKLLDQHIEANRLIKSHSQMMRLMIQLQDEIITELENNGNH